MKQIKFLGVLAVALTLGLAACNGGGKGNGDAQWESDKTNHWHMVDGQQTDKARHTFEESADESVAATCTVDGKKVEVCSVCGYKKETTVKASHKWGQWQTVTAATCQAAGQEKRVCSVCQAEDTREIAKTDHTWGEWIPVTEADCTNPGSRKHVCSVCQAEETEEVPALGHDWVDAEDQSAAIAPTCTEAGTKIQKCSRCNETQEVETDPLGHDFSNPHDLVVPGETEKNTKGEIPFHWAKITNYSCSRGDSYRYAWSAKEVNFDYKNVAEGAEPELLDEGEDGIRFWGRPIGNAMALSSEGRASGADDEKIPDESVKGSRFEFDFQFDADVNDVCLSAELTPAQYTNDIFKNRSGDQEWTPGYRFVDGVDDEGNPVRKPEMIEGMRYIIYLDGVEVDLDESVNTRPNGRGWYQFPCKLNLTAGKHNLNIAMAGGYLHTFYQFSFEKVAPAHEHAFKLGEKAADSALYPVSCRCGQGGYELKAADLTTGQKAPVASDKNTRLGKNNLFDDVWNITGIAAGTYDLYLNAQNSSGNDNAYWNAATAIANGDKASNNGNTAELQAEFRYKVKVDDGEFVNIGSKDNKDLDQFSDFGLSNAGGAVWTNKPVAQITIAAGAASLTIHNMDNGYSIWIYGARLIRAAA